MNVLLNRIGNDGKFQLPADGWFQVVPMGSFKHSSGFTEQVDSKAVQSICNRFAEEKGKPNFPGVLVDFDHFSCDSNKPSAAAGWIEAMQNRSDGVWAQIRWSDEGRAAVEGGSYRLVSPVFASGDLENIGNRTVRPLRLASLAVTNDPQMRGAKPLSNRKEQMDYKSILLSLLGLDASATDQAIQAACDNAGPGMENACGTKMKNRMAELELQNRSLIESQVEADLATFQNRFKADAKPKWKAALLSNRASALELLASLPEPAAQRQEAAPTMHNRANTSAPKIDLAGADPAKAVQESQRLIKDFMLHNRCSYDQARDHVRSQKPELFGL